MRAAAKYPEDTKTDGHLPSATIKKSHLSWAIWLIPVAAAALCVWFAYHDYIAAGPLITIYFKSADGLQVENTLVTYRGATIGAVKSVVLSPDAQTVTVKARLSASAKNLARQGSVFWIVRPEVRVGAISGLGTLVSGEYITVQPGSGPLTNTFVGAEEQPIAPEPNALAITFLSESLNSLQEQSPIFYRGVQVGQVDYFQLAPDARNVMIHARVWNHYAPLVRRNSEFWNAGGVDFSFGLFKGLQVSAESPKTIFSGGIQFATPPDYQDQATNGAIFVLKEKEEEKWKSWAPAISLQLPQQAFHTNSEATPYLR
jgi:paraquat-inducible protein B